MEGAPHSNSTNDAPETTVTPPPPTGSYLKIDAEGFFVNEARLNSILPEWRPPLEVLVGFYREAMGHRLHSVYVRGSVPRGRSLAGISGIDTVGLVRSVQGPPLRWQVAPWANEAEAAILAAFPFVSSVEAILSGYGGGPMYPQVAMLLQTQSVCLHGPDITPNIKRHRLGPDMVLHAHWLRTEVQELHQALSARAAPAPATIQAHCRRTMKHLIRVGFELVMETEGCYTDDLYLCYRALSKYFPAKRVQMTQAYEWCFRPTDNAADLLSFVDWLAPWLEKRAESMLGVRPQ